MSTTIDVGDEVPHFTLDSQVGPIVFRDLIDGKWCALVTFKTAFEPVATTNIGMLMKMASEFESRSLAIVCMANDSVSSYRKWIGDVEEIQGVKVNIPIMSDIDCAILKQFGCAKPSVSGELRVQSCGVFLIDMDKRVRATLRYSPSTGHNFYEILRLYDALQLVTYHRVVCPSNWTNGQEVMIHPNAGIEETTHFVYAEVKPWFKITNSPEI